MARFSAWGCYRVLVAGFHQNNKLIDDLCMRYVIVSIASVFSCVPLIIIKYDILYIKVHNDIRHAIYYAYNELQSLVD